MSLTLCIHVALYLFDGYIHLICEPVASSYGLTEPIKVSLYQIFAMQYVQQQLHYYCYTFK